ncbi:chromobox protein homolog 3 isoform X2 [Thrips palmi]|uniref:Chromobox protein homolog 3 isoform X2 n=1 Tax=Thrips palmi TaxID=161013 RepID=A0A6P8ZW60_THRPL|nr:chromobox protein homolog 3 isoform X2 [Thrips palmi]
MRKVSKARSAPTEATEVEQEEAETPTGATPTKRTASKAEKKEIEPANANGSSSASAAADADDSDSDGPESFEVESILDSRVRHGKQQFKIRWKGYGPADDTWEDEENVDSPDLIAAFLKGPSKSVKSPPKKKKTASPKGKKRVNSAEPKTKPLKKAKSSDPTNDDSDAEYEVSKIMDYVELKDGTRQFLVRWKGFSAKQNTWEPEANLNCQDLIEKFLALEQEKEDISRETRVVRKQVYKYNPELTKRSSHRTSTKKRISYHDLE